MPHSKSLKIINRTTAALSSINITKKNENSKHLGAKNRKKVKTNSTGNIQTNVE